MRCPVCGYDSTHNDKSCGRCGTVFSLFSEEGEVEGSPVVSIKKESEEDTEKSNRHHVR